MKIGVVLNRFVEQVRGFHGGAVEPLGTGHVEIGFVDGGHLHFGREAVHHVEDFLRALAVALGVAFDEDRLRAKLAGCAQGHGGVDAKFPCRVAGRGDYAALVGLAAYDDGLAFERWVVEFFHRDEEGVHVEVEDGSHGRVRARRILGIPARSLVTVMSVQDSSSIARTAACESYPSSSKRLPPGFSALAASAIRRR